MIKENENIEIWEFNLFNAIKDVSDITLQKKAWLGKHQVFVSSYSEVISVLYDDFDFERYIEYCNSLEKDDAFCQLLTDLDEMISKYEPLSTDEMILTDPLWLKITEKAKEICSSDIVKGTLKK